MKTLLRYIAEAVKTSFWFLPSLLVLAAFLGAFGMVAIDSQIDIPKDNLFGRLIYSGNAEGARGILGTIAGAMITIAGVVFSLTMVTLTLASSQFGPRLIRNFMKSRGNQLVLGTFIATFIYCLLVLLTVHRTNEDLFVPGLAVSAAVLIAVINAAMLVWFIHHLATIIQADLIVADVADELDGGLDEIFPEHFDYRAVEPVGQLISGSNQVIKNHKSAYLQAIQLEALFELARKNDLVFKVEPRPGDMLMPGAPLLAVYGDRELDESEIESVRDAFLSGSQRSAEQDTEFTFRQLVEIALRALSPSTNDPFTAVTCIDRLGAAMCRLAERKFPVGHLLDDHGSLRLIVRPLTFAGVFHAAFDQLRQIAPDHAAISIRLLEILRSLATCLKDPDRIDLVAETARMLAEQAHARLAYAYDREAVAERLAQVEAALEAARGR